MKPAGAGAVMADRARGEVAGDSAAVALHRRLEFFPTPPWSARAGGELIGEIDPPQRGRQWECWEPACGLGHMAHGLAPWFRHVRATDIHDYGCDLLNFTCDFLGPEADGFEPVDWIVTNPPFGLAAEFVAAGLRRARRGVAILARSTFFESATRFALFFDPGQRLYAFAPFFERVPMTLGRWDPRASTATAYAWFVWMTPAAAADMSQQTRRLLSLRPEVWPIAPGTRERLTRPADARDWGVKADAPLFEGVGGG